MNHQIIQWKETKCIIGKIFIVGLYRVNNKAIVNYFIRIHYKFLNKIR